VVQLKQVLKARGVDGFSRLRKDELIAAVHAGVVLSSKPA
jgi:hypothetical protein